MSVSDLTGTRWLVNETFDNSAFNVNMVFNIGFYCPNADESDVFKYCAKVQVSKSADNCLYLTNTSGTSSVVGSFSSYYSRYRLWHIWGGQDTTNQNLIDWLELNAVQQEVESEEYLTNTYDLTQVANAVRNVTKSYIGLSYPSAMVSALNNMGDFWTIEQLMSTSSLGSLYYNGSRTIIPWGAFAFKNITTASFPNCTSINYYAFYSCSSLTTALFPNCISINSYAFSNCIQLTTISFPNCTSIGSSAFYQCYSLATVSFPSCTSIGSYAFAYCSALTIASFPSCTSINSGAFSYCRSLTTISFPIFSSILNGGIFSACYLLSNIYMPSVTGISNYTFALCSALSKINFSYVSFLSGGYTFRNCISLSEVILPNLISISGQYNFMSCYNLISLNLTGVSLVPSLQYSNTFSSTPIDGYSTSAGQYGSIYVPASLYDAFTSATNWTYFSARMVSV